MKRVLSGIKPTGEVTLGNYLGAMRRWADEQAGRENFYFIPNLHALTSRQSAETLLQNTLAAGSWLLAMGVDPSVSTIFVQSQVPAHSELMWILNNYVTMGELNRMTQFKDKSVKAGAEGQLVGLYDYPVLMAADILLYDADEVPVGEDQKQHVELTRDIASRFNNLYGDTFQVPQPTIAEQGARIMNLQDPSKKMSKSEEDNQGCIFLTDSTQLIRQKVMRAVTDSGSAVQATDDKPAVTNLLVIYSQITGEDISIIEERHGGSGYGDFKSDLADRLIEHLEPIQHRYRELMANDSSLRDVLDQGQLRANEIANLKIAAVRAKLGLL
jgi:tryptophanyl-tRNA synthetase